MATREIEFDDEEIDVATSWHGGGSSMLYAIASTGVLRRGTVRPYDEGRPLTDKEWMRHLAEKLAWEAEDAAKEAKAWARKAKGREREELLRDHDVLLGIADKAQSAQR